MKYSRGRGSMLGISIFMGMVMLILGTLNVVVELGYENFDNMPVTSVADAKEGDTVKITASVNRPVGSVYVIWKQSTISHSTSRGTRVHTSYQHLDDFLVHDSTGALTVSMTSDDPIRITGGEYSTGDPISVVGTVEVMGTEKTIQAQAVARDPKSFSEQGATRYFGHALLVIGIILVAAPAVSFFLMLRERRRNPPVQITMDPTPIEEHI
jgi:hypothetical protein